MSGATMRAWQSDAPGVAGLALIEQPVPEAPPGSVLIRVETAALNFSDQLMIDDRYQVRPPRPFVPGQEVAGTVVAGDPATGLAPGDRIAAKVVWGGFADYAVVRGDMAIKVPAGVELATAACLPVVYTTAMVALTESTTVRAGETVLVLAAAGGVGLAAVEIAKSLGATVFAAAGGEEKGALALAHGADHAIDYRADGWGKALRALTGGKGVDVVVDPVGGAATKEALRALGWEGRLLVVGFSSGEIPTIPANRLLLNRASAIGVYWSHDRDGEMLARVGERITRLLEDGAIRPHVGNRFAFEALPAALAALSGRQTTGKVVLTVHDEGAGR